jgi:outer membrane receptor for ferrienterochelin and colicins
MYGWSRRGFATLASVCVTLAGGRALADDDGEVDDEELGDLSLDQLMQVSVSTASNVDEKLGDAPASVIVLSRTELENRGYRQLGDLFDDLPGMDVVRPHGDNWVLVYWRGFRGDVSAPFLLMIDGVPVNSLYFLDVDVPLTAYPLSSIDRVEIVQGPASSVYGPNAFMGVVNVITQNDADVDGLTHRIQLGVGTESARVADATVFYKQGTMRFRLGARFETGVLDDAHAGIYEYTRPELYNERGLWGGFVDNPGLAGFASRHVSQAVDAHLYRDDTELAVRYMSFGSGYGVEYAGDRALNNAVWRRYELDTYLRHKAEVTSRIESRTLLRYRRGGIGNDSFFVDGYSDATDTRLAAFSYWQSANEGISAFQDVAVAPWRGYSMVAGLKLEQKDLQKAYDVVGESASGTPGGYEPVDTIDASTYAYPEPPANVREPQNRITTEDVGAYVQLRKDVSADHHLHLGGRIDRNSGYDVAPTLRAGYVGKLGSGIGVKALYGQAFQEPPPRVLYGGWDGSGSDPDLKPQRSETLELDASLTLTNIWQGLALYTVHSSDTIVVGAMPKNSGEQLVIGLDWSFRALVPVKRFERVELWGSYTRLFHAEEDVVIDDGTGGTVSTQARIGDLSRDKFHLGASIERDKHVAATLRARWFGRRTTTPTNPVGAVDSYGTADATVLYRDVRGTGLGVSLTALNIFDAAYVHPGINDASAGDSPGQFVNGVWQGSSGFFASEMPQPGRTFLLSLWLAR